MVGGVSARPVAAVPPAPHRPVLLPALQPGSRKEQKAAKVMDGERGAGGAAQPC